MLTVSAHARRTIEDEIDDERTALELLFMDDTSAAAKAAVRAAGARKSSITPIVR